MNYKKAIYCNKVTRNKETCFDLIIEVANGNCFKLHYRMFLNNEEYFDMGGC